MDETQTRSYKPNFKRQSNEWKNPGSPCPKKVRPTQCAVKVMFIEAYDIDGVIPHHVVPPRQTVNAAQYCTFLQHHIRPVLRRKRRHLVVRNPTILLDNARSHRCCCHGLLAPLAMGDSGTSTVVNRYEPMRLRSLRQSKRTIARDPVQHKRLTYPCYRAVNLEHHNDGQSNCVRRLPNI